MTSRSFATIIPHAGAGAADDITIVLN